MALGDLPFPLSTEHGQPDQVLPFGDGGAPNDIASAYRAGQNIQGTPLGEPAKNVYTVSVYDSRPPNGVGVVIDKTLSWYDTEGSDPFGGVADIAEDYPSGGDFWQVQARYNVVGGQVFILKGIDFQAVTPPMSGALCTPPSMIYRLCIDGTPVNGLDRIIINCEGIGLTGLECFVPVGSNSVLTFERYFPALTAAPTTGQVLWLTRFTGDLLLSQNVTLPWEYCNVE